MELKCQIKEVSLLVCIMMMMYINHSIYDIAGYARWDYHWTHVGFPCIHAYMQTLAAYSYWELHGDHAGCIVIVGS